tara:strand:- start:13 stop:1719 length:1707 start_codon:yes stop_codon:yes gene_type:complete
MAGYTQEENEQFNSNVQENYSVATGDLEGLLDSIADALIRSQFVNTTVVEQNQKFIRNGQIKTGQGEGILALYQKDVEANVEDNLQSIADQIVNEFQIVVGEGADNTVSIGIIGGGDMVDGTDISNLVFGDGNPLNVSQFIPLARQQSSVNINKANEFLDTNIFELLPEGDTRQSRIIRFFQELNALLPPNLPQFDLDNDGRVDRDEEGNWISAEQYSRNNSISYAQDNQDSNIDEEDAFIHRLTNTANDTNSIRTIEEIYNVILPYLTDILEEPILPQDDRPVYENQSGGYLKFRNPNQGIIIRNTQEDFIEGLDPNNLTYLDRVEIGQSDEEITEGTGFTITMWVRFLDKVSSGTLFNFGNPTRTENPYGFRLETFVINKDDKIYVDENNDGNVDEGEIETFESYTPANHQGLQGDKQLFKSTDAERFVRLQVREFGDFATGTDEGLRDSGLGYPNVRKFPNSPPDLNIVDGNFFGSDERRLINYTHIPENFNEWYFICATYNPRVNEVDSFVGDIYDEYQTNPDFWLNHINPNTGEFEANSGYGNKCKVEIISRTDLLRARGFKV